VLWNHKGVDVLGRADILDINLSQRNPMANDLLVKNFPRDIRSWIDEESHQRRMTLREFVVGLLRRASTGEPQLALLDALKPLPPVASAALPFSFVDLFAGIGGLRMGLQRFSGRCVFSSEWDQHSQKTYEAWFGETPHGTITKIKSAEIPNHDVLAAGFSCQPFLPSYQ